MTRAMFKRLLADASGATAIEFAVFTSILFFVFLAIFDFASVLIGSHRLGQAVSAAADDAFVNRAAAPFTTIPNYVINASGSSSTTVAVTCNGTTACTNSSRACACLSGSGIYSAAICSAACTGSGHSTNQTAGYYMTINASTPYTGIIVPTGLMGSGTTSRSVTVRLQ